MKALMVLVLCLQTSAFCGSKKATHVLTESEMCWRDSLKYVEVEFPTQDETFLETAFARMTECSDTLRANKFKSRMAYQLSVVAAESLAFNSHLREIKETKVALANAELAKTQSDESLKVMIQEYTSLQQRYVAHLNQDVITANEIQASLAQQSSQARGARGYFANVLQGMSDGAKAEAAKPRIHCESVTFGNQTSTDCR